MRQVIGMTVNRAPSVISTSEGDLPLRRAAAAAVRTSTQAFGLAN